MKLLDECREKLRLFRYALRTERSYLGWIERYIRFCKTPDGFRHPRDLGAAEVTAFLTHLAGQRDVSASTQKRMSISPGAASSSAGVRAARTAAS